MILSKETIYKKDLSNKKIKVTREFEASVDRVWNAWTKPEILDQWWAPKPWKAETKSMDLRDGGKWLYSMNGPDKEVHWCRVDYKTIEAPRNFTGDDYFTDESGKMKTDMPVMHWNVNFQQEGDATKVTVTINFDKPEDIRSGRSRGRR